MYGFFHFLYKRKQLTVTIIKRKWRVYQATEVVPSCVIVVTLGHNLGKDLAGFVSGGGCQVFHGISGF
jgi:hypothetical protein